MEDRRKKEIELLAPAGSYETFLSVIRAGADAVYLGGSQFGARAYANNFTQEELLRAIDYAHIHDRQVYLTVNTLFKQEELEKGLYEYLLPYYEQGLDAVIIQDMGALSFVRSEFPGLDIHTSTQMTVAGCAGAAYMKELGASRVVTAREMSLAEIRKIHETVDIEIESFVHGALCYCYSGQCLLSSMLGGRSGNRGRCAQPCRLPYEVYDAKKHAIKTKGNYVLSPKDLCTIAGIPELSESGIYSFKIEGRMKQAEYAAGVVSIYRSYIDAYLENLMSARARGKSETEARAYAKECYKVSAEDQKKLLDMGNRSGFTDGYYYRHNGSEMITFGKPNHAKTNENLQSEIREKYIHCNEIKEKINGILRLKQDIPAIIEVTYGGYTLSRTGDIVQQAQKQPLTREKVEDCVRKTGNTPFEFEELVIDMDENIFMPVQAIKQLRRDAIEALEMELAAGYRRCADEAATVWAERSVVPRSAGKAGNSFVNLAVSIENRKLTDTLLSKHFVTDIYFDSLCYERNNLFADLKADVARVHSSGKKAYYILPAVFRSRTEDFYQKNKNALLETKVDGVVVKSYDAAYFAAKNLAGKLDVILDHSIYTWNQRAKHLLAELNPLRDTAPLEANRRELTERDNRGSEMLIYGYLPLMTSAQCVHANTGKCDAQKGVTYLKDRYGKFFPVKNNCSECYNTIYNTTPLLLFGYREELNRMGMAGYRISFTIESGDEADKVLDICEATFLSGRKHIKDVYQGEYTNGHYKRGVE